MCESLAACFAFRCSASLNMTALFSEIIEASLTDAKLTEHGIENLFHINDANDFANRAERLIEINRNVLAGQSLTQRRARAIG